MHPTIQYQIAKAQIADRQRRADQNAIARSARRGHRALTPQRPYPAAGLARRLLTLLAPHGRPARVQPGCQLPAPCHACG